MDSTVSVVSHGHEHDVGELLAHLAALDAARPQRVIVTLNLPEPSLRSALHGAAWPFELHVVDNAQPAGFGANHNRAFALDRELGPSEAFVILNPDLRWRSNPFQAMLPLLAQVPGVGLVYPVQLGLDGHPQDHERLVPTLSRLWARYRPAGSRHELASGAAPEWVNAAFVMVRQAAFDRIGGFDERYHMYCEDVDLCLRLQLAGWQLARADGAVVEHAGRRASRRELRHFLWHLTSLWRLSRSRTWQAWRTRQSSAPGRLGSIDPR